MANSFYTGLVLPATENLKIGWTQTDAETFIMLLMQVTTDNGNFGLVETRTEDVQSVVNPPDIDTNYDVLVNNKLVASWENSMNRSAEWLINCGPNNGYSCGPSNNNGDYYSYIIVDTSNWSTSKRTITDINTAAINELIWEDLELSESFFQVFFNSVGGTDVATQVILPNEKVVEPTEPVKELYVFDGWYLEPDYQTEWDFANDTVTEDITLYARWDFDETLLDLATTETAGAVKLSDVTHFDQLELIDDVITEEVEKKVLESILDDIDETLDEIL